MNSIIDQTCDLLRLLGEPTRLRLVLACRDDAQPVTALAAATGQSQSLVSHHLRLLRAARVLRATRRGRQIFYALYDNHIRDLTAALLDHMTEPHGDEARVPAAGDAL